MILDEDFNAVGETLFPENEFRSDLMFVLEDGLYISSSHYKNPIYDEEIEEESEKTAEEITEYTILVSKNPDDASIVKDISNIIIDKPNDVLGLEYVRQIINTNRSKNT